jgi:hypothetical protein
VDHNFGLLVSGMKGKSNKIIEALVHAQVKVHKENTSYEVDLVPFCIDME